MSGHDITTHLPTRPAQDPVFRAGLFNTSAPPLNNGMTTNKIRRPLAACRQSVICSAPPPRHLYTLPGSCTTPTHHPATQWTWRVRQSLHQVMIGRTSTLHIPATDQLFLPPASRTPLLLPFPTDYHLKKTASELYWPDDYYLQTSNRSYFLS